MDDEGGVIVEEEEWSLVVVDDDDDLNDNDVGMVNASNEEVRRIGTRMFMKHFMM